ncbi:hypothetical protein [Mycobacterium tilburgii]|nr:hypothetical protein [Mycobacterium tilburgii]
MEARLAAHLWAWLDGYAGHDDELRLRRTVRQAAWGTWRGCAGKL